jgi:hypothetical protein
MDIMTKEDLRALMQRPRGLCVSIYMPTQRTGREVQQDPIRLKNLLARAEEHLLAAGLRSPRARELLRPARLLLADGVFWQHQSDGLAVLLSQEGLRCHCLPCAFDELVVVAERFHIKPLLLVLSSDRRFYVLALSQDEVRLLQGTRRGVSEVDLKGVPGGLAGALRWDDPERQLQFHTSTCAPAGGGKRPAAFHGHGVGADDAKENVLRYFHRVDQALCDLLQDEGAPMVLAGVDYLLPIYREASRYPHLLREGIEGSPECLGTRELHERAWAIVHPLVLATQKEAAARYRQLAGTGSEQACSDLRRAVSAAYQGRVDTLFVALGLQRWGCLDPDTNLIQLHEKVSRAMRTCWISLQLTRS